MEAEKPKLKAEYEYVKYDKFIVLYVHDGKSTVPFILSGGLSKDGLMVEFNRYDLDVYFESTVDNNVIWVCWITNKNDPANTYSRFVIPSSYVDGYEILRKNTTVIDNRSVDEKEAEREVDTSSVFGRLKTGLSSTISSVFDTDEEIINKSPSLILNGQRDRVVEIKAVTGGGYIDTYPFDVTLKLKIKKDGGLWLKSTHIKMDVKLWDTIQHNMAKFHEK